MIDCNGGKVTFDYWVSITDEEPTPSSGKTRSVTNIRLTVRSGEEVQDLRVKLKSGNYVSVTYNLAVL